MDTGIIKSFADKLASLEQEWVSIKQQIDGTFAQMKNALQNITEEHSAAEPVEVNQKRPITTEQTGNFPYAVGKIVQVAFPELFKRKLVSAGDLAYLLSMRASKDFHIKGTFPVLIVHTTDNDPQLYRQGVCRYYKNILLGLGAKKYHLTNQFRPNSRADVLKWIYAHGLKRQELLDLMKQRECEGAVRDPHGITHGLVAKDNA